MGQSLVRFFRFLNTLKAARHANTYKDDFFIKVLNVSKLFLKEKFTSIQGKA